MSDSDFVDVEGVDSAVDYSSLKRARQVGSEPRHEKTCLWGFQTCNFKSACSATKTS